MTQLKLALAAAMAVAGLSAFAQPAAAAEYPWCVQYTGGEDGGGRNCGFVSYEQCMATARGAGGDCQRNLFYEGAPPTQSQRPHKRNPKS
jgi:hypothetical protein